MVYWTLDYFKILYGQYTASGVSVRAFCKEHGISENRFYYWVKILKHKAISQSETPKGFIQLHPQAVSCLTGTSVDYANDLNTPIKSPEIKITYPNGVVLQLEIDGDIEIIKRLITLNS